MEYRSLGKSGLQVSALSFGSWVTFSNQLDDKKALDCMSLAYEAGVNFFDNAEAYAAGESEKIMGRALKKLAWSRDTYIVSSKVFWGGEKPTQRGLSRKHIYDACDAALKRLQVDYLDLFFCHRPDHLTPIEETVSAMDSLIKQGKVCYWGTSEWSACDIMQAYSVARERNMLAPTMEQPQYNMFSRNRVEREYASLYREIGLGTTIWSPLASGILTGKYAKELPSDSRVHLPGYEWLKDKVSGSEGQKEIQVTEKLRTIASELEMTLSQLAICWCLKNKQVSTVILGASKKEQLHENLKSMDLYTRLTNEKISEIELILENKPEPIRQF